MKDEVVQIGDMMICSPSVGPIRCILLELRPLRLFLLSAAECRRHLTRLLFCFISALCEALQALPVEEVGHVCSSPVVFLAILQ